MDQETSAPEKSTPEKQNLFLSVIGWFDTHKGVEKFTDSKHIDIWRIMPFILMHLAVFGVIWVGFSWVALGVCLASYLVRMFAITGFYHRYFSHCSFETNRFWQFIFSVIGSSAVQRGPIWWASQHRHHHRFSDQEPDSHAPSIHGFIWSHVLWFLAERNFPVRKKYVGDLMKFKELVFIDRFDILVPFIFAWSMFGLGWVLNYFFPGLGTSAGQMVIWGFVISTVLLFHGTFTINSLSHLIGTTPFPNKDNSRNNFVLALITLGEGWHNNHHYYPASTRQGFLWWEIDITYYTLVIMSKLRIIRNLKSVPDHVIEKRGTELDPA